MKGGEGKASEEQEPQFQIHNLKDPAIYSIPGPLQESSLTPCRPVLALSLLASDGGPARATGEPAGRVCFPGCSLMACPVEGIVRIER